MVRYGYALGTDMEPSALIRRARELEAAGFAVTWSHELFTSPFVPLAVVAPHTQRIGLGCSIAYAFTRSPMETAITAMDLDRITGGRFILGLGVGVRRLNEGWHGTAYGRPAPHIKECVQLVRLIMERAFTGEGVRFQGHYYDIDIQGWKRPGEPVRDRIPIYVAAVREGMARTAGEVADGILGHTLWAYKWAKDVVIPNVVKGLKRSGKERKQFDVWGSVTVAISRDKRQALRDARGVPAFYATVRTYKPVYAWHGFQKETAQIREAFVRSRGFGPEVLEPVHEEMVNPFVIVGTVDEVRKRVAEYEELYDSIELGVPHYFVPKERVAEYEKALLETFSR